MRNGNSSGARIITQRNHQREVVKAIVKSKTVLLQYCRMITYNMGLIENCDTVVILVVFDLDSKSCIACPENLMRWPLNFLSGKMSNGRMRLQFKLSSHLKNPSLARSSAIHQFESCVKICEKSSKLCIFMLDGCMPDNDITYTKQLAVY